MSDSYLRELERRWRESGAAIDEAAYLAERVRAGDLDRDKLDLAAYLGHEPAKQALNWESYPEPELMDWITGIVEYGESAVDALSRCLRMLTMVAYNQGQEHRFRFGDIRRPDAAGMVRITVWAWARLAQDCMRSELKNQLAAMMIHWALHDEDPAPEIRGNKKPGSD